MAHKRRFHRIRHHGRAALGGAKGTLMGAAAGGAAAYGVGQLAANVEFIRNNWYAPALALAVAGHFLKRRYAGAGQAIIGAAGAIGYYSYALTHQGGGAPTGARGFEDATGIQDATGPDAGDFATDVNALTDGNPVSQLSDVRGADAGIYESEAMGLQT